jgi:predicted permease
VRHLRLALRTLARTPLLTSAAILSLALGIGANTAVFSLVDQILVRKLPVRNPEELAIVYSPGPWQGRMSAEEPGGPSFSYPLFRELQRDVEKAPAIFAGLAGARSEYVSATYGGGAAFAIARWVSGNYFELLGVRPVLGRLLNPQDDRTPGAHPVAVLSHAYWRSRLGANPAVLNRTILVNGRPLTVVGVSEEGFSSETPTSYPTDLYLPISMREAIVPDWKGLDDRQNAWVNLFLRLRPGVTLARAEAEINVFYGPQVEYDAQRLRQPRPDFLERFRARKISLRPGGRGRGTFPDNNRRPLLLLMGLASLVLGIACANVANLQLARVAARSREMAIRLSVGASRGQLIRQLLTEAVTLSLAGGILGLPVAYGTLKLVLRTLPSWRGFDGILFAALDLRVLLFSLAVSIATAIGFGLLPALSASKPDLANALKAGHVSAGSGHTLRKTLVTAQVAVAVALLISGGLFARTLANLTGADLGLQVDRLINFSVMPKLNGYSDRQMAQFHEELTDRLAAIPGVTVVSSAQLLVMDGDAPAQTITVEGFTPQSDADEKSNVNAVGANYFRAMGIPVIAGREFTRSDVLGAAKVAMVNEAFVKRFFLGKDPLGRHMAQQPGVPASKLDIEIVGVVKDSKHATVREAQRAVYYTPVAQNSRWFQLYFYLRSALPPEEVFARIRQEVAAIDPNLPVRRLQTMRQQIDDNLYEDRILAILAGAFAALATVLAVIGLYGVLSYNIARRTREIGIRVALGAVAGRVRALVLREVAVMLVAGSALGVVSAAAGGKLVQSLLYGVKPWDGLVYGSAVVLLWLVALAATWGPTRRATRIAPMVALREE